MISLLKRVYAVLERVPVIGARFRVVRRLYRFIVYYRESYLVVSRQQVELLRRSYATLQPFAPAWTAPEPPLFTLDLDLAQVPEAANLPAATQQFRYRAAFELYRTFLYLDSFMAVTEVMDQYRAIMKYAPGEYVPRVLWDKFLQGSDPTELSNWCLDAALILVPNFSEVLYAKARRLADGDPDRAMDCLRACILGRQRILIRDRVDIHNQARSLLGRLLSDQGRDAEAYDALRQIPEGVVLPEAQRVQAEVCIRQGKTAEAMRNIDLAMQNKSHFYVDPIPRLPTTVSSD